MMLASMNVPYKVGMLKYGDYVIKSGDSLKESLAFERKDVHDLIGSIMDGRLKNQLSELSSHFNRSYIIVEGVPSVALVESEFDRKSFFNSIMSATLKRSLVGARGVISSIITETPYDTAIILEYAHRKLAEGDLDLVPAPEIIANAPRQVSMLSVIPGVGYNKARAIMEHCGTLREVFRAMERKELKNIKGIGPKIEQSIIDLFETDAFPDAVRHGCHDCSDHCQEPDGGYYCKRWKE